jgi:hypothetical protein
VSSQDRGTSHKARQSRTQAGSSRRGAPWTAQEDAELAACPSDDALEAFAVRHGRTFASVEQRRKRPRTAAARSGTGWI